MHEMRAMNCRLGWKVTIHQAGDGGGKPLISVFDAAQRGRSRVLAWRRELIGQGASEAWQAELPKACIGEGEIAIGYAEAIAEACAAGNAETESPAAQRSWLSRRSLRFALHRRRHPVALHHVFRWADATALLFAAITAWISLLIVSVQHVTWVSRLPTGGHWLMAVHGEWSNRTRHVLELLKDGSPPLAILILGRPHISLALLRDLWAHKLGGHTLPEMLRPWSVSTVVSTFFRCARTAIEGIRLTKDAPYLPGFREQVAMFWRAFLGEASAAWWHKQKVDPCRIVYGHTGNADTTLLELAQQAAGHSTTHIVHGISAGLNFTGRSSVAVFRCGHDTHWHSRLGGYGDCIFDSSTFSERAIPAEATGLLLLTSLAHPMYPGYRAFGLDEEKRALRLVAQAAKDVPDVQGLMWKPHPAIASLSVTEQQELAELATSLGFLRIPAESDWRRAASSARWIVTTASTAVVELIASGHLPTMIASDWVDSDSALARYPCTARTAAELVDDYRHKQNPDKLMELRRVAWMSIQPASNICIENSLRRNSSG